MADKSTVLSILIQAKDAASAVLAKIRGATIGISKDNAQYAGSLDGATASSQRFSDSLSGVIGKLAGLAAGYASVTGLKSALESILSVGGKFETLTIQIENLMGGVQQGAEATAWIKDFAKNTPLQLEGVTKAFVRLKAFGLDPMDGTLQALTDMNSKLGGDQETLEGIVLAVGQAWSTQKLQMEEINQLVERGVPVWDLLGKATGRTTQELQKMSAAGEIGRTEIKALLDEIGKSSEGASASMMGTWAGLISNLDDTWNQFLDLIAQSGALDYFKAQIADLLKTVEQMAASGELQKTLQAISDFFVGSAATVKDAIQFIRDYSAEFKALATVLVGSKIAGLVSSIGTNAAVAAAGVGNMTTALGSVANVARAGLYGLLAAEILKIVSAYQEKKAIEANTAANQKELEVKTAALTARYADLSKELGLSINSMADLDAAVASGAASFDEQAGKWVKTTQAARDFDAEIANVVRNQEQVVSAFGKTVTEMTAIGEAAYGALGKFREWGGESGKSIEGIAAGLKKLSDEDLQKMRQALTDAFEVGINRTEELDKALKAISTEQVTRAWATLGEKSSGALKSAADAARNAYTVIRDSGSASAKDLERAWDAYIAKVLQANSALRANDQQEKQRKQTLADLDAIGTTGQQQSEQRRRELTQQTIDFEKALRAGNLAEAVRIAQEKEKLAADNAKAEKQAFADGEAASYQAYDARQKYLKSIEDTKRALAELSRSEQQKTEGDGAQKTELEVQQEEATKLQQAIDALRKPIQIQVVSNLSEQLAQADALQQKLSAINSGGGASAVQGGSTTDSGTANAIATEALKRGSRNP